MTLLIRRACHGARGHCDINADFLAGSQAIGTDIPLPAEPTLAAGKRVHEQRRPRTTDLSATAEERARGLARIEGGEMFQDALIVRVREPAGDLASLLRGHRGRDVAGAEIDEANRVQGAANVPLLAESSRAVSEVPLAVADALAAVDGCRFVEFDARARVRDARLRADQLRGHLR